jgi:hypothetical protein
MSDVLAEMRGQKADAEPTVSVLRHDGTIVMKLKDLYDSDKQYRFRRITLFTNGILHSTFIPRNILGIPHVYLPLYLDRDQNGRLDLEQRATELGIGELLIEFV